MYTPSHSPLHTRIHRLKEYEKSLSDCAVAIYAQDDYSPHFTHSPHIQSPLDHIHIRTHFHTPPFTPIRRLKEYEKSLSDCAVAIYAQDDCKAAWVTKAEALHCLGRHVNS